MKEKIHFIDCGANIGQSAEWAVRHYGDDLLKVDSFEPQEENYVILEDAFKDNPKVETHQQAVWIEDTDMKFYQQNWGARTGSSLVKGKTSTDPIPVIVKGIDFGKWIQENVSNDNYNVLKMDIEGAEYDLLPHLLDNVQKYIDEWFVEFHGKKAPNYNPEVEQRFYDLNLKCTKWTLDILDQ